jgi:hypothetical protein
MAQFGPGRTHQPNSPRRGFSANLRFFPAGRSSSVAARRPSDGSGGPDAPRRPPAAINSRAAAALANPSLATSFSPSVFSHARRRPKPRRTVPPHPRRFRRPRAPARPPVSPPRPPLHLHCRARPGEQGIGPIEAIFSDTGRRLRRSPRRRRASPEPAVTSIRIRVSRRSSWCP